MDIKKKVKKAVNSIKKEVKVLKGEAKKEKVYSNSNTFASEEIAKKAFEEAKQKLFVVDSWSDIEGIGESDFFLYDNLGNRLPGKPVEVGNYIQINVPGPLPQYWVLVTNIREEENMAEFVVRPSGKPNDDSSTTQHFFTSEATSTFRIERKGTTLTAYEIGDDEGVNNDKKEAGNSAILNTIVAEGGWLLFQEIQWNKLTKYLIGKLHSETENPKL